MAYMPRETSGTVIGNEPPFTGPVQSTADERPSGSFGLALRDVPELATTATAVAVDFSKPVGFSLPPAQARPRFVDSFSNDAHGGSSSPRQPIAVSSRVLGLPPVLVRPRSRVLGDPIFALRLARSAARPVVSGRSADCEQLFTTLPY